MNLEEWILFLDNISVNGGAGIDYILFGAEAVTHTGDNVFPQIITGNEIEKLVSIKKTYCVTKTICVAESYKFLSKSAYNDAASMPNKANYTLISNNVFDAYISECSTVEQKDIESIETNWMHSCDESRRILYNTLEHEHLIAFDYCPDSVLKRIRLVAADIDDTITIGGKIHPEIIMSFNKLYNLDIKLVLVTGRSSGWAQAIISYFPAVDYIIAENGAIIIDRNGKIDFPSSEGKSYDISSLRKGVDKIKRIYSLVETKDSIFRLREITLDRPSFFLERDIEKCNNLVSSDVEVIASSIHIHLRFKGIDKGISLSMLNKDKYNFSQEEIAVIGDSATDASLFNFFKISIGVANILNYTNEISPDLPKFITKKLEGNGFLELVNRLHSAHN